MPAHIGVGELLKLPFALLSMNLGRHKSARAARRLNGGLLSLSQLYRQRRAHRALREHPMPSYDAWRDWMDRYDPDDPNNTRPRGFDPDWEPSAFVPRTEWTLYLRPDTPFDRMVRMMFDHHNAPPEDGQPPRPPLVVTFIDHKSNRRRLKRIEAQVGTGPVAILWSDA